MNHVACGVRTVPGTRTTTFCRFRKTDLDSEGCSGRAFVGVAASIADDIMMMILNLNLILSIIDILKVFLFSIFISTPTSPGISWKIWAKWKTQ
jgi:hypothetical protein